MVTENYVVLLDVEKDFCRLFRSDSIDLPTGDILWSGDSLRHGYDAMIRLNKERRPVEVYSVCSTESKNGRKVFRICKGHPKQELDVLSIHSEYVLAREEIKKLTKERDELEKAKREYCLAVMRRVGIESKRIPKWTPSDLKYIAWLEQTGKMVA